ncbi:MAG TPA: TIGR04086 family membrane protein [Clostridiales bacterium]|nr:TIGR04086 family membrane protein [Clostridiales bacterium]
MRIKQASDGPGVPRYFLFMFLCTLAGTVMALLILAIFSFLIIKSGSFQAYFKPAITVAMIAGGFLSGFMAARGLRKNGLATGLFASILCLCLLWLLSLLGDRGQGMAFLMPNLLCMIGGLGGGILGVNLKQ